MGKNKNQPLFRITISTVSGVEMKFWVKRGYTISHVAPWLWRELVKRNIHSKNSNVCYSLTCDDVRMDWAKKFRDYNIRDDVDVLPKIVVVFRLFGT